MVVFSYFYYESSFNAWFFVGLEASLLFFLFKQFVTYFALMNYLIPLSLVVTLDVVRFIQAMFIESDEEMFYGEDHALAKTSNLNDDLAQVDYIFSDKTGTLTDNIMCFKEASIGTSSYNAPNKDDLFNLLKVHCVNKLTIESRHFRKSKGTNRAIFNRIIYMS